jgi:hypothetical protein
MSRDARRAVLKEVLDEYDRGGYNPARGATIFGVVRDLHDILSKTQNFKRASEAAAFATRVYDTSSTKYGDTGKIDCKKGCYHCCHTKVTINAPEAFHIANALRARWQEADNAFREDYLKAEIRTRALDYRTRFEGNIPCPLLINQSCTIHPSRPLSCRAYASRSVQACIDAYNLVSFEVPQPNVNQVMRSMIFAATKAALNLCGLPSLEYELGHAVTVALGQKNAESQWLDGTPVFADVLSTADQIEDEPLRTKSALLIQVFMAAPFGKEVPANPFFAWPS